MNTARGIVTSLMTLFEDADTEVTIRKIELRQILEVHILNKRTKCHLCELLNMRVVQDDLLFAICLDKLFKRFKELQDQWYQTGAKKRNVT